MDPAFRERVGRRDFRILLRCRLHDKVDELYDLAGQELRRRDDRPVGSHTEQYLPSCDIRFRRDGYADPAETARLACEARIGEPATERENTGCLPFGAVGMCLPFTPGSPNGPAYRITPPAGVGHAVETVYAAGADCDGVAAIGTVGFMFEEGPNCVAFPPNTPATWTAPPGTSLGQFSLLEAGHVHIDCNDGDMVLHATLCSDADCHSCVPVAATDGSQLDFDVVGECVTGGYVDFRWIAAVCPSSSGGEYFEPVAGEGCNSFVQMDMYDRYGVTGGQTTLQQCADAVRRLDGQEGCRADYFFFEDGGYCNCPTDSCENGGDNSAAGGPGQLYRFAHVAAPTAPGATPAPTGTPDPPGPGAQCFAGLTDMGSASALITPLGSTPECSSLVATIFGRIFPLLATPEAIPAAVAGLLDTSSQQFCECFAAIDDSLVVALLPVGIHHWRRLDPVRQHQRRHHRKLLRPRLPRPAGGRPDRRAVERDLLRVYQRQQRHRNARRLGISQLRRFGGMRARELARVRRCHVW